MVRGGVRESAAPPTVELHVPVSDLDPVILRNEASKCRRLAATMRKELDVAMLERLAIEYEALAAEAESASSRRILTSIG